MPVFASVILYAALAFAGGMPEYQAWREKIRPGHPRIFFNCETWPAIEAASLGSAKDCRERLLKRCDGYPDRPVCTGMDVKSYGGSGVHSPIHTPIPDIRDWGDAAAACALAWRFTREPRYLAKVKAMLLANVDGFNKAFENRRAVSWYAHSRINSLCAYDWVYEGMTPEERRQIIGPLLESINRFTDPVGRPPLQRQNTYITQLCSYSDDTIDIYAGLAAAGDGDVDELAEKMMRRGYLNYKRVGDRVWDGATGERILGSETPGYSLGDALAYDFLQMYLAATGENLAVHFPGLARLPEWLWWLWIPDRDSPQTPFYFGTGDHRHETNRLPASQLRPILMQIVHFYRDLQPESARLAASLMPLVPHVPLDADKSHPLAPFLLSSDPPLEPQSIEKLQSSPAKACRFEHFGHIIMRSGWKPDSTYAFISAGCDGKGLHKHFDEGGFVIYKHDFLALDTGSRAAQTDFNLRYYYPQSVAHNVTLVMKPGEKIPPSWGPELPKGEAVYNHGGMMGLTSKLLKYEACEDYTHVAVDLTAAYGGKCRENVRHFVHVHPDCFVVYDRIESADASWEKKWLLHTQNEPVVSGRAFTADSREGRLVCQVLLPADARFEKVGGPGKEFWSSGRNWPLEKGWQSSNEAFCRRVGRGPYWGQWRMETIPGAARAIDQFLHVITVGSTNGVCSVEATLLQDPKSDGVLLHLPHGRKATLKFNRDRGQNYDMTYQSCHDPHGFKKDNGTVSAFFSGEKSDFQKSKTRSGQ